MNRKYLMIITALVGILVQTGIVRANDPILFKVSPDTIGIGAFYDGTTLSIKGVVPSDCEAVIRIMGEQSTVNMKRKEKVFGILWMNRTSLTFESVPSAFLMATSKTFEDLLETRKDAAPVYQLGLPALSHRTVITPETPDRDFLIKEFLRLKEKEGLYAVTTGIRYAMDSGVQKNFEANPAIPAKFPPGKYVIEVYAVKHGDIVAKAEQPLVVKLEGFPALLADMAFNHGTLYGILATLNAIIACLFTGLVFGRSKGAH
ncbi:MAG: TIGR02186 family protein [Deltaproteobacteria bacterium]|nr:TIGR02186 family protein [Deltaproteobacteria bacterium]